MSKIGVNRTIGLWGAVATLVGFVVGATVFILPAELAQQTGPAVVLSFGIAAIMAMFSCFVGAQIGSVYPLTGASFVASSRLISPFFGFMYMWLVLAGVVIGIAVVSLGFAHYFNSLFPDLSVRLVAASIVLLIALLNLIGSKASVASQAGMVIVFMVILIIFIVLGSRSIDSANIDPFIPNGFSSIASAAIPAYFSFIGFQIIIEIGGEIKRPGRNIPLALLISFLTVLITYIGVAIVIVGNIPWQTLSDIPAPFSYIANHILPSGAATVVTITILAASASSINGLLFGFSRDVVMLSKVGLFPASFGLVSKHSGQPTFAIVLLSSLAVVTILLGGTITEYAIVTVIGVMIGQVLLGISTLRMTRVDPALFDKSQFKLGVKTRFFFAIGLVALSTIFILICVFSSVRALVFALVIACFGALYYRLRSYFTKSLGAHISQTIASELDEMR